MIDYSKFTPKQLKEAKEKEQSEVVKSMYIHDGKIEVAKKAIQKGLDNEFIIELTDLLEEEIDRLRNEAQ